MRRIRSTVRDANYLLARVNGFSIGFDFSKSKVHLSSFYLLFFTQNIEISGARDCFAGRSAHIVNGSSCTSYVAMRLRVLCITNVKLALMHRASRVTTKLLFLFYESKKSLRF
jgi:hypothetical protein